MEVINIMSLPKAKISALNHLGRTFVLPAQIIDCGEKTYMTRTEKCM